VENLDFSAALDYLWLHDCENTSAPRGRSIGDLAIGGRYRFMNLEAHRLEAACISGLTMPTGTTSSSTRLGTS
jgi:hypothetical protein